MSAPLKVYTIAGYTAELHENRIDIVQKSCMGSRRESVLFRNITDVSQGIGKPLTITTTDGKKRVINIAGKAAEEWQVAIIEHL